jgi:hypothetical protein
MAPRKANPGKHTFGVWYSSGQPCMNVRAVRVRGGDRASQRTTCAASCSPYRKEPSEVDPQALTVQPAGIGRKVKIPRF